MCNEKDPLLFVGQIVHWFPFADAGQEPQAALVTKVGAETLNVSVFSPNTYNARCKDGARHMTDPKARDEFVKENGGWQHTPLTTAIAFILKDKTVMALLAKADVAEQK